MRTTRKLLLAIGSAGVLALGACSAGEESASTETPTVTSTAEVTESAATTSSETMEESSAESTTESAPEESTTAPESSTETEAVEETLPRSGIGRGSTITVAGETATVCIYGDGWGTNVWAAGENTSCEFVSATYDELTAGLNATQQNIRDNLPGAVNVHSPVTGDDYELSCAMESEELIACRGGDNAAVFIY